MKQVVFGNRWSYEAGGCWRQVAFANWGNTMHCHLVTFYKFKVCLSVCICIQLSYACDNMHHFHSYMHVYYVAFTIMYKPWAA